VVEGDGWLDVDRSRRVRHVISGEIPYPTKEFLNPQRATSPSTMSSLNMQRVHITVH
jgi:hypothetical protein